MLALVWSLGLLFTAVITNTLRTIVKGQVMLLMMMETILEISTAGLIFRLPAELFASLLVMFVKFESNELTMLREKRERRNKVRNCIFFIVVVHFAFFSFNV